jgi:acylphosphatase
LARACEPSGHGSIADAAGVIGPAQRPADDAGIIRRQVVVHGRVQGVGFRASCAHRAVELAVEGWVRNLPGGQVEGAFEGTAAAVDALVEWCRHGPRMAQVTKIEVINVPPNGEIGFTIR